MIPHFASPSSTMTAPDFSLCLGLPVFVYGNHGGMATGYYLSIAPLPILYSNSWRFQLVGSPCGRLDRTHGRALCIQRQAYTGIIGKRWCFVFLKANWLSSAFLFVGIVSCIYTIPYIYCLLGKGRGDSSHPWPPL